MTSLERREALLRMGTERMTKFCEINNIRVPRVLLACTDGNTGMYFPGSDTMHNNLEVTALDVHNPAHMRWSWPGYKTDRTACGVV